MFRLLGLIMMLVIVPCTTAKESFSEGCQPMDGQFYGQDKVGFYCFTEDENMIFDSRYSLIDLRHCVGNNRGSLVGFDDGEYQSSCDNCTLESIRDDDYRTCYLKCECYDMDKRKKKSKLDLNDVLKNDNGRLVCFGHRGTRERYPPECHHNTECSTGEPRLTPRSAPTPFAW